jgi:predicted metalloprotease
VTGQPPGWYWHPWTGQPAWWDGAAWHDGSTPAGSSGATAPGWYAHPHTGQPAWWDGAKWVQEWEGAPVQTTPRGRQLGRQLAVGALIGLLVLGLIVGGVVTATALLSGGATDGGGSSQTDLRPRSSGRSPATIEQVVADLERFWAGATVPGLVYTPIAAGAVSSDPADATSCGGEVVPVEEIEDNALYCIPDDYVYYDDGLFRDLSEGLGESVPAIILAHEWGHRIQALSRMGQTLEVVLTAELQADCFAAAWVRDAVDRDEILTSDDPLLDLYRTAVVIGDQEGLNFDDPSAHGTAFDRAGAMSTGWDRGVAACVELATLPPPTVQGSVFADLGTGDLPFEQLVQVGVELLDASYPSSGLGIDNVRLGGCDGGGAGTQACGDGTIGVDESELADLYDSIGDMAAWVPLVEAYLDEVSGGRGAPDIDCAMGALAQSMLGEGLYLPSIDDSISLAAEDLDELLLQRSRDADGAEAFERLDAIRSGFEGGWAACE